MIEAILLNIAAPVVTAIIGWMLGRRKADADADSAELMNVKSAISIYNEITTDLKARMDLLSTKCDNLAAENEKLRSALLDAHNDNTRLKRRVASLEEQIKKMTK